MALKRSIRNRRHRRTAFNQILRAIGKTAGGAIGQAIQVIGNDCTLAGKGLSKIFRGKRLNRKEQKALFRVGIGVAMTVLTIATEGVTSPLLAGALGRNALRHVGHRAVHRIMKNPERLLRTVSNEMAMPAGSCDGQPHMRTYASHIIESIREDLVDDLPRETIDRISGGEEPEGEEIYDGMYE